MNSKRQVLGFIIQHTDESKYICDECRILRAFAIHELLSNKKKKFKK